jgi:hypothetical protein
MWGANANVEVGSPYHGQGFVSHVIRTAILEMDAKRLKRLLVKNTKKILRLHGCPPPETTQIIEQVPIRIKVFSPAPAWW